MLLTAFTSTMNTAARVLRRSEGASAVEYAVLLTIAVAILGGVAAIGLAIAGQLGNVVTQLGG